MQRSPVPGVKAKLALEAGEGGFDPASLTKKQESHLRLSEMRIEQRHFPLPSRGTSGQRGRFVTDESIANI